MPKAYGPEDLADTSTDVAHVSHHEGVQILGRPISLGLGEMIAGLSALYLICMAAFNAGYFLSVKGQFIELFTFTDLIGSNIQIVQYFLLVYSLYALVSLVTDVFSGASITARERLDQFLLAIYQMQGRQFRIALWFVILGFLIFQISDLFLPFNVAILIYVIIQGFGIRFLWLGWQNHWISLRTLLTTAVIAIVYFAFNSGRLWLNDDIKKETNVHSISLRDDKCIDRIALRSNATGYLFYSIELKQFEFRSKDDIKTIFARRGCV